VSPPGVPGYPTGLVIVTVTTPAGTSVHKIAGVGEFAYDPTITGIEPNTGPAAGGTRVTIHGEGFAERHSRHRRSRHTAMTGSRSARRDVPRPWKCSPIR
jgi:hypothetical protein